MRDTMGRGTSRGKICWFPRLLTKGRQHKNIDFLTHAGGVVLAACENVWVLIFFPDFFPFCDEHLSFVSRWPNEKFTPTVHGQSEKETPV